MADKEQLQQNKKEEKFIMSPEIEKYILILKKEPRSPVFAALAEAYRKGGMLDEAISVANEGLKNNPGYISGRVALGKAYFDKGELDKALEQLKLVVKSNSDNIISHKVIADIYIKKSDTVSATQELKTVLFLSPDDKEAKALLNDLSGTGARIEEKKQEHVKEQIPEQKQTEQAITKSIEETDKAPAAESVKEEERKTEDIAAKPTDVESIPATEPEHKEEISKDPDKAIEDKQVTAQEPLQEDISNNEETAGQDTVHFTKDLSQITEEKTEPEIREAKEHTETDETGNADLQSLEKELESAFSMPSPGEAEIKSEVIKEVEKPREPKPEQIQEPVEQINTEHAIEPPDKSIQEPITRKDTAIKAIESQPQHDIENILLRHEISPEEPKVEAQKEIKPQADESEEEIHTVTMADLYVKQGHFDKAYQIYKNILLKNPDSPGIRAKLVRVKKLIDAKEQDQSNKQRLDVLKKQEQEEHPSNDAGSPDMISDNMKRLNAWLDKIKRGG